MDILFDFFFHYYCVYGKVIELKKYCQLEILNALRVYVKLY